MGERGGIAPFFTLFEVPASLAESVAEWVERRGPGESAWQFGRGRITTSVSAASYEAWDEWRKWGTLPRLGGWLDQPLGMYVRMKAIDLVYNTISYKQSKEFDLKKLSATQTEILRWREKQALEKHERTE